MKTPGLPKTCHSHATGLSNEAQKISATVSRLKESPDEHAESLKGFKKWNSELTLEVLITGRPKVVQSRDLRGGLGFSHKIVSVNFTCYFREEKQGDNVD